MTAARTPARPTRTPPRGRGLDEGTVERVIEAVLVESKRLGASEWEVYMNHLAERSIEIKSRRLHSHERAETATVAVRILLDRRMGFSYTTLLEPESIRRAVRSAIETARCLDPDEHYGLPHPSTTPLPMLELFDPAVPATGVNEKIGLAMEMEAATLRAHRSVQRVRKASYDELYGTVYLFNSNGLQLSYAKTYASLSVMAVAEKGADSESAWDFDFSVRLSDLDPDDLGQRVGRRAAERLGGTLPRTGQGPVVLENQVAAQFLSLLAPSFHVENVVKKKSLWGDILGRLVMAKAITLVDSGLETRGANAAPFDAEGVVSRRTPVVERGTLRSHLCDTYWARRTGRASTANARRGSSQSPPVLAVSNLHIEPGTLKASALLAECGEGVFITEVIGLHTADPISGDFSLGAMGRAIVKGKPSGPVRGFGIAGNLARLFRDVAAVGSDLRFMGAYGSPSLLISEMHISGN